MDLQKAGRAFRYQISNAILTGDGMGKPLGIMNPAEGIPIMETSEATAPSQFSWQDVLMLKCRCRCSISATPSLYEPAHHGFADEDERCK
jgi:hypothetical protein